MTATIGPVLNRSLAEYDPAVAEAIGAELHRQRSTLEMIAAENFAPVGVLEAQGLVLTSKYAEGGCEHVDVLERLAIDRVKALFGAYPACPVAAGRHLSPVPHAHVTMTTTHKAPRRRQADQRPGTRREGWRRRLPVRQGGPLENVVAAKGVAAEPEFLARRQRTRRGAKLDGTQAEDRRHEAVKPGFDAGKLGARVAALAGQFPLYLQETR